MSKVSIIIPCKNAAEFLDETLLSIRNQSFIDWECILVDDHSTDSSLEVFNEFAAEDARFQSFKNTGVGVIHALQCGYKHSTSTIITRMDADDLMPVNKLSNLLKALEEKGTGHVATGKVKYFDALGEGFKNYERWLNKLIDENSHRAHLYKECVIASPNWMLYRKDFERIGAFDSAVYPEDYELVFRMFSGGLKVAAVNEVTHLWRDHEQRASRVSTLYAANTFLPLKLSWFLKLNRDETKKLILLGAGKKGKAIAKELKRLGMEFIWQTNNPKKIGHFIYEVEVHSQYLPEKTDAQVLLGLSSPGEVSQLEEELSDKEFDLGEDYFVVV
jgi:glycosyltransferase involved in cell wall biosynthesis|tara:strand:+ start:1505 stop:2497 length:993 start_codon:yes stop_codon:yes gene_type:complete